MNVNYKSRSYNGFNRWTSYWYQINECLTLSPSNILEVGMGNGLVSDYLKNYCQMNIKTVDIDSSLKPDIVAPVTNLPLEDDSFDVVLCAEVLEHLDFQDFEKALKELKRISKRYVILTLPHFGSGLRLFCKFPKFSEIKIALKFPFYHPQHNFDSEHYWEINKRNYELKKIKLILSRYFTIIRDFIPFENPYHHFFIIKKASEKLKT